MMNSVFRTLLLAVLASFLATTVVYAQQCLAGGGSFGLYFDQAGTQRYMDPGPPGSLVTVYVFGEGFQDVAPVVSGVQFCVDYGPNLQWIADVPHWGATIGGGSDCEGSWPTGGGLSIGFGFDPQFGAKFKFHEAICMWIGDCTAGQNVDGPIVREHQLFPDPCPVIARFPDHAVFDAFGARSQTCQMVELDIDPLNCPNLFSARTWQYVMTGCAWRAGWMAVAVLGSETVNVNDIDKSSILLEGVAPEPWPQTTWFDVGLADGDNDCVCDGAGSLLPEDPRGTCRSRSPVF